MKNILYLSHLPQSDAYRSCLNPFLNQLLPPTPEEVEAALSAAGVDSAPAKVATAVEAAKRTEDYLSRNPDVRYLHRWHEEFPVRLREIPHSPWALFVRGTLPEPQSHVCLSVVGTRRPNLYGRELLFRILSPLGNLPVHIVSGLAFGVDGLTHQLTLDLGLRNFAVLGTGIDRIYPKDHESLAKRLVAAGGGIITETPPFSDVRQHSFPWRNRLISGLSHLVWIVQGTIKSGSKHTGDHAAKQGRTVVVTPGDVFSELSATPHYFLGSGAQCVTNANEMRQLLALHAASEVFSLPVSTELSASL